MDDDRMEFKIPANIQIPSSKHSGARSKLL